MNNIFNNLTQGEHYTGKIWYAVNVSWCRF